MRVSIITGGGSGIGAAVARRLAARDQCLMLHGQGADAAGLERLKAVAMDCQRVGASVEFCTGDLANAGTATEIVCATRASFGAVDAVVHAAGFADRRNFLRLPRAGLERAFAVMAAAFHELVASALPDLTRGVISTVRDRVCMTAAMLVLEPIFEADLPPGVLRLNSPVQVQPPTSSYRAIRARMPDYLGRRTQRPGNRPPRRIRSHDWPNPTKWPRWSPFCCRRRLDT